jgi:hypothetical protein
VTTLLLERSPLLQASFVEVEKHDEHEEGPLFARQADARGRLTLDELITSVWEGLAVRDLVSCPVCAGPMKFDSPAGVEGSPVGSCGDCGSRLS